MSVIGGQNPIVQDGLVYILDFGNERSYTSGSNSAQSLIYNPVTASFTAPPAGDYSGLAAAYSVRRVVSSYSGPAMEVQSGSVSASIGFDSLGNLDTASLESFAGSGDAFVKTWYDQSGNGRHVSQIITSQQPQVVSGGSVVVNNGKPSVRFINTSKTYLQSAAFTATTNPIHNFVYFNYISATGGFIFDGLTTNQFRVYIVNSTTLTIYANGNGAVQPSYTDGTGVTGKNYLMSILANGPNSSWHINNLAPINSGFGTTTVTGVTIGRAGSNDGFYTNGYITEFISYASDQSINRLQIQNEINNYYSIYSPTVNPPPKSNRGKLEAAPSFAVDTNQSFPGFSYDQGNLTLIFTGETKAASTLFSQDGTVSINSTTSSIGYGSPTNNLGRTFPASGFDHISLRFTTGSVDCFVNGIPTAPNSIFPTGSFRTGNFIASNYSGSLGNLLVYNRELTDDEIYDTYLQQARRYGLPEAAKPYTVDSSVYAYTQAAGITGSAILTALDAFVSGLKANNLWNKMIAIYPFLGSDTVKTRYNLKDPSLNTTAITYSGSWSASDSGSYNNNTSSYGILENIKGDYYHPLISSESIHLSYLSYDTPASGGYLMGVEELVDASILPGDTAQPAAAYSVRKVRTAYTGSAMEVRRDFDDLTFDVGFDGNGNLDTGSLLTKMTASLNTPTLPGDYSGLAAAYSLRKVSSSYSGYAVEVRRAVDNYSASIGFDGSGNLNTASLASFIRTGSETPIDAYSGLAAAYSLRKVVPTYGGDAIEIQSGSVSQSIGFDSFGDLDVAAIKSFAGSGDAFVKTWYDQSGNNNHATQSVAANQPQIYSGSQGSVILENNKPAIRFDGSNDILSATDSSTLDISGSVGIFTVVSTNDGTGAIVGKNSNIFGNDSTKSYGLGIFQNVLYFQLSNGTSTILTDPSYVSYLNNRPHLLSSTYISSSISNNIVQNIDGTLAKQSTSTPVSLQNLSNSLEIGGNNIYYLNSRIQEILIYASDQSANRTYIENNINSYYGIYTPDSVSTEDAYVKTWYDQSGNGYHATQVSESRQPQIVSSGVIVTENGKPSLQFDGVDDRYSIPTVPFNMNAISLIVLSKGNNSISNGMVFSNPDPNRLYAGYVTSSTEYFGYNDSATKFNLGPANTSQSLKELYADSSTVNAYRNSIASTSTSSVSTSVTGNDLSIGSYKQGATTTAFYDGNIQEIIFYTSSLTASRNLIEDNINGYYNIFSYTLESGSGYVSKWYDQSGNDRHMLQPTTTFQPLVVSSGSIVEKNNKTSVQFNGTTTRFEQIITTVPLSSVFIVTEGLSTEAGLKMIGSFDGNGSAFSFGGFAGGVLNETITYYGNGCWYQTNADIGFNQQVIVGLHINSNNRFIYLNNAITKPVNNTFTSQPILNYQIGKRLGSEQYANGKLQELIFYSSSQANSNSGISNNINNYYQVFKNPFNSSTSSLSLFATPSTLSGGANSPLTRLITGGPLGLVTISRTGSAGYTLWKNRTPLPIPTPSFNTLPSEIYINAANINNSLFSSSQNTISYASVGAGLTDDEVYTYYELVDNLQTSLNRGVEDPNAFITIWDTTQNSTSNTIVLPLFGTQAITASWGDGLVSLISSSTQVDRTHSYSEPGVYTVTITGTGQGFRFANSGDTRKLIDIVQWGNMPIPSTIAYQGCISLTGTANDSPNITTTDVSSCFSNASRFNGYVNNWDVSNVTDINNMFYNAVFFNQNIGSWNVEKVTSMYRMFFDAVSFTNGGSPDINNWRPISCSNFSQMFYRATAFNQPIGNWPLSASNINMSSMFYNADSFNQNIGSWDVSNVTLMNGMFNNADAFNQNIGSWNVEKVTSMAGMFSSNDGFNNSGSSDINNWRPISCSNFSSMFNGATAFNQPIGNWPLSASNINMRSMFRSTTTFNQDLGNWDTSRVSGDNMRNMFQSAIAFNNSGSDSINNWDVSNITTAESMFLGATAFNQNIGSWNVSNITNFYLMFYQAINFNNGNSPDISNWTINTSSAVTMQSMFEGAKKFNQPIGSWDVSKVTNMASMLRDADAFNQDIGTWNLSSCTNLVNFMLDIPAANYSYLHTIYDGWINNKLNPNLQLVNFGGIKYSASAAEGRGLLSRTYNTASIIGSNDDFGQIAITCSANHNVVAGNKIFISGSSYPTVNGVQLVHATGSATTLTIAGVPYDPLATDGEVITGYGWQLIDGGPV